MREEDDSEEEYVADLLEESGPIIHLGSELTGQQEKRLFRFLEKRSVSSISYSGLAGWTVQQLKHRNLPPSRRFYLYKCTDSDGLIQLRSDQYTDDSSNKIVPQCSSFAFDYSNLDRLMYVFEEHKREMLVKFV
jgi:hypothetical protein